MESKEKTPAQACRELIEAGKRNPKVRKQQLEGLRELAKRPQISVDLDSDPAKIKEMLEKYSQK